MISIIFQIFIISFLINLLWEVLHSRFYDTCINMKLKNYIPLIVGASLKDGFWISLFYLITVLLFQNINILLNLFQLFVFVILGLSFSFVDEKISIKRNRWKYSRKMPQILGVGITPLIEIALTGLLTFLYVFLF